MRFPEGSFVHQAQQSAGLVGFSEAPLAVHPTQLYEAAVELTLFVVLIVLRRHKRQDGQLFLVWLWAYAVARTVIELFRGDSERGVYLLSTSQYVALGIAITAGVLMWRRRRGRRQDVIAAQSVCVR